MLKQLIHEWLANRFVAAAAHFNKPYSDVEIVLKDGKDFSDYACSSALMLAKKWQLAPSTIAEYIVAEEMPDFLTKAWVTTPGFINLELKESFVAKTLLISNLKAQSANNKPQTIVIDYSSPNLAKALHVGHLRTSLLGDALARINQFLGHNVIRQNHVGDWGTQFGMILAYIEHQQIDLQDLAEDIEQLEQIYLKAKIMFDQSNEFAETARLNVVRLQAKETKAIKAWQKFRAASLHHCQEMYNTLGLLLKLDDVVGESFYQDKITDLLTEINHLLTESDGALCYFSDSEFGQDDKPLPVILRKQDGAFLYSTTDLAAIQYRIQKLNSQQILYVVDQRQSLHFKLLFELAEKCNWQQANLQHIGFGTVNDANGRPFKTRDGGTVKLSSLIDAAIAKAITMIQAKQPDKTLAEIKPIAQKIAISALKYNDLSKPRTTDYSFCYEQMLKFEGNTAPYILYAYARLYKIADLESGQDLKFHSEIEVTLAKKMLQLPDVIIQAANDSMPHYICNYLFELASFAMKFYEHCPINSAALEIKRDRQKLAALVCLNIKQACALLGIETLSQM